MAYADVLGAIGQGQQFVDGLFQQQARRQAGGLLARGDTTGAARTAYEFGDLATGNAIQDRGAAEQTRQRTREAEDRARNLGIYRNALDVVERSAAQGPEAAVAAFEQAVPGLRVAGADDATLEQLRTGLRGNTAEALAVMRAAVGREELELRDGGGGDVVGVNKRTGEARLVYDAPDRPIMGPYGILLPPASRTPGAIPNGAPAPAANGLPPVTGPAISGGALWSRQEQQESGGRQSAVSPVGAFGVAQLMPETANELARQMGVTPAQLRSDENLNRQAGQMYMDQQLAKYGGNEALALAAYNAGPGRVDEWIERFGDPRTGEITTEEWAARIPFQETRNYVRNITGGQFGDSAPVAQGDGAQMDGAQELGGGWSLQQMQTPADLRANRAEGRAERAEVRAERAAERSMATARDMTPAEVQALGLPEGTVAQRRPDGSVNVVSRGGSERFTEGQRNAAYFSYRLTGASRSLENLAQQGIERPSPAILAFGEGRLRENALSSEDRRWLQASRNWLAPILRKDTGAAITAPEVVFYMGEYLPSPTDDPATIQQKAAARRRAEQALRGLAGGAYDELFPGDTGETTPGRRLRFQATPDQLSASQRIVAARQGGAEPRRGTAGNPILINPADANGSYGNVRAGQYYLDPTGTLRQRR